MSELEQAEAEAKPEKAGLGAWLFGGAALFSILVANAGVVARYVLKVSLPSVEEILRYLFVWLIFVGSALAFKEGTLISITMLGDSLKKHPVLVRALSALQNLAILVFSLVSLATGWDMMMTQFEYEEVSVVLEINMGWITLGAWIGYLLLAFFSFCNLFRDVFDPDNIISVRIRRSVRGFFPKK